MLRKFLVIGCVGALSACGGSSGSGGDSDEAGGTGVLSSGVLTDVEVPSADDLANLPADVQTFVNDFVSANESLTATATRPTGSASFTGGYGFGFDDADNPTVVYGDMTMTADFDTGNINGTVTNLTGDSEGTALTINNDLNVLAVIDNAAEIAGTVAGDVELEGETYEFEASLAGSFGGANADTALGTTMGLVTNPDSSTDSISGYFLLDKD